MLRQTTLARLALVAALAVVPVVVPSAPLPTEAERWVEETLERLTIEELAGQLLALRVDSTYLRTDSDEYEAIASLVQDTHAGSLVVSGGREPVPDVLLNPWYAPVILGQPLALASTLNRLQALADVPLLVAADVEWGPGMRIAGATHFPRAMAFGAAGDPALAEAAGRITAVESRAMGVHVAFAPVADVNANPRNPVINVRSFGEDPARVADLVAASVRGLQAGGVMATLKHFPGHGDTDVDSHLGLPVIDAAGDRLRAVDIPPFAAGLAAGAGGVMAAHIGVPALDPSGLPATLSRPMLQELLRGELGFDGLIFSDSMQMAAIQTLAPPGALAAHAVAAGIDIVLDPPDARAARAGIVAAVADGTLPRETLVAAVRRVLEAKARLGLDERRRVDIERVAAEVGGRQHDAVARDVARRALTLMKDEREAVPLTVGREARVVYVSVLDYPANWGTGAPARTLVPELKRRWPGLTAIELSDRSTADERDLVANLASGADAVIAGVFVRAASGSARLDLPAELAALLERLARDSGSRGTPFVAAFFGRPYAVMAVPRLPAVLLTFDISDHAEAAVAAALAGEQAIGGRLPVALPGLFPVGHGLDRHPAVTPGRY